MGTAPSPPMLRPRLERLERASVERKSPQTLSWAAMERSRRATRRPAWASSMAAAEPAGPPPRTIASNGAVMGRAVMCLPNAGDAEAVHWVGLDGCGSDFGLGEHALPVFRDEG